MTKVSVVIPAYNAERYIGETIDSVLTQTFSVHEIIVVDDGSTDGTAKIVKEIVSGKMGQSYSARKERVGTVPIFPIIRYIYQANQGPATARNRGIKESTGDYIAFLDSDDMWLPEKMHLQINKMIGDPGCGLMHTNRIRINIEGGMESTIRYNAPEGSVFNELLWRNFICTSSALVKKVCFSEVGLFDENRNNKSEDYDMWLRIARKYKVGFIDRALVKYRVNDSGHNRSNIKQAYDSERAVFLKMLEFYSGDRAALKQKRLYAITRRLGDSFFHAKNYEGARGAYFEALKLRKTDARSAAFCIISMVMNGLAGDRYEN